MTKLKSSLCNCSRSLPSLSFFSPSLPDQFVKVCKSVESNVEARPDRGRPETPLQNKERLFTSGDQTTQACAAACVFDRRILA